MTVLDPEYEAIARKVRTMPPEPKARFLKALRPDQRLRLKRAFEIADDPLGTACYRDLGYEPICIPRVKAALAAGYAHPLEAEAAGMPDLPAPCGECPAERYDAALEFDVLFGGAVGGSKTKSTLMLIIRCMHRWPGFRALFLRETFDQLDENVYPELRAIDYAEAIGGKWNAGRRQLDLGPSACRFRYLADATDVLQRRGGSYHAVVFDERNLLPPGMADALRDRLRSANPAVPVLGIRSTANPGGPAHGELKQQYVKPDVRTYPEQTVNEHGDRTVTVRHGEAMFERRFIASKPTDNPYLGPDYAEQVLAGIEDPVLRAAQAEGDWDAFVGQFFGEWSDARHVIPRDAVGLHDSWRRYEGIDYGRRAPWCMLRGALDGDGRLWLYRELYRTGLGEREQAKLIHEDELKCGDTDSHRAGDPSMWNKTGDADPIAETYRRHGVVMVAADNDRKSGWARVHTFLGNAEPCVYHARLGWDSCPLLHVLEGTCPNLVRTLPDLPFSRTKFEDLDTDAEDHAADALRYLVMEIKPTRRRRMTGAQQREAAAASV